MSISHARKPLFTEQIKRFFANGSATSQAASAAQAFANCVAGIGQHGMQGLPGYPTTWMKIIAKLSYLLALIVWIHEADP